MGFLRNLFWGKPKSAAQPEVATPPEVQLKPAAPRAVKKSTMATGAADQSTSGGVNIWDFDTGEAEGAAAPAPKQAAPAGKPARGRRNKTRIIGFESASTDVVSLFDGEPEAPAILPKKSIAKPNMGLRTKELPVGWLTIVGGSGTGRCFTLTQGQNSIGSATGKTVKLSFGDVDIAQDHARITFDLDGFRIEHGETAAEIALNDAPVASAAILSSGDTIRVGSTTLRFVALCGDDFNWPNTESKDSSNAATA